MSDDKAKRGIFRAVGVMAAFTFLSRILGLVREIVRAHFLGTSAMADAFTIAFMLPNLFRRLVGEGAMTAAAVPTFVSEKKRGGVERLTEIANAFLTLFAFMLTAFSLLFIAFSGFLVEHVFARGFADDPEKLRLTIELTEYMFFYLFFISLAAIMQAILNSFRIFGPSSFTPVLLNIAVIASAFLLHDVFSLPVYAFAFGVMLGGVLQLGFQIPYVWKAGVKLMPSFRFRDPGVKRILMLMIPGIFGAGVYQVNVLISQMIATYLSDGAVSALQYSSRLEEFTLGVFVVALGTAVLPTFSDYAADGEMEKFRDTLQYALRLVSYVVIPASVGMFVIRYPMINLLFRTGRFDAVSVELTAFAFSFHVIGLLFIGWVRMIVPAFYAVKDMITPVKAAVVMTLFNIAFCLILFAPLAHGGIAAANSIGAFMQAVVLFIYLSRKVVKMHWRPLLVSLLKALIASGLMGFVGYAIIRHFSLASVTERLILIPSLFGIIVLCALIYAVASRIMKAEEFSEILAVIRRKKRKGQ